MIEGKRMKKYKCFVKKEVVSEGEGEGEGEGGGGGGGGGGGKMKATFYFTRNNTHQ